MASEKERIAKLESRANEAENALRQLDSYVELLKKKSIKVPFSEESRHLEAENEELKKEILRLKQELILEEIRNGVEQYPVPKNIHSLKTRTQISPQTEKDMSTKKTIDVSRLDMRIGRILKAWKHPHADTLYIDEVDLGEEGRVMTICSGLVKHIPLEQMQGLLGVFLCNLKPVKMKGVFSEGMIICATSQTIPEKIEILDPPIGSEPGDRVFCLGYEGTPDPQLNPKKKIFKTVQPDLRTNDEGVACYRGVPFTIAGKGVCRSQTMKGTGIR